VIEAIGSLILATTLLLGSPGPVPIALAATGASFGVKRGVPFLAGILCGLAVAITLGSLGIVALFSTFPASRIALGIAGALYICYIAVKIATAPLLAEQDLSRTKTPSFRDGFILNLLNPKAYAAFVALFSQFLLPFPTESLSTAVTALVAFGVAILVDGVWLVLGGILAPLFRSPVFVCVLFRELVFRAEHPAQLSLPRLETRYRVCLRSQSR